MKLDFFRCDGQMMKGGRIDRDNGHDDCDNMNRYYQREYCEVEQSCRYLDFTGDGRVGCDGRNGWR